MSGFSTLQITTPLNLSITIILYRTSTIFPLAKSLSYQTMMVNSLPGRDLQSHDVHPDSTSSHCFRSTHYHHDITASSANESAIPSVLHRGEAALPIGPLFGQDHASLPTSISDPSMHYDHGSAPVDGEQVWYCSGCGDGPISIWQNVCVLCSHQICSSCKVEAT